MESDGSSPSATTADAGYLEPSTQLPAQGDSAAQRVIGTLDLNQGVQCKSLHDVAMRQMLTYMSQSKLFKRHGAGLKLPSEELIGHLPYQPQKPSRAYLSNVCTAKAAQRQVNETAHGIVLFPTSQSKVYSLLSWCCREWQLH